MKKKIGFLALLALLSTSCALFSSKDHCCCSEKKCEMKDKNKKCCKGDSCPLKNKQKESGN